MVPSSANTHITPRFSASITFKHPNVSGTAFWRATPNPYPAEGKLHAAL